MCMIPEWITIWAFQEVLVYDVEKVKVSEGEKNLKLYEAGAVWSEQHKRFIHAFPSFIFNYDLYLDSHTVTGSSLKEPL